MLEAPLMPTTRLPPPVEPEESRVTDPVTADLSSVHPWKEAQEPSQSGAPLAATPWPGTNPTHEEERPVARGDSDRKSTRLNSSHVSISYAVFCLKKKK